MKKVAVILAGSGVYDGTEIHEAVFTLLAIAQNGAEYQCFAPNKNQAHVINHLNGEEQQETRNVLVESARIARGEVLDIAEFNAQNFDALIIPGGFGAAKNLNRWAFEGPNGSIDLQVQQSIQAMLEAKKPVGGLCMGPTVIAKALENSAVHATLTVGSNQLNSPYDIQAISEGMQSIGAKTEYKSVEEITIDAENKIVTAPCYMMEANIVEVHNNIQQAVKAVLELA